MKEKMNTVLYNNAVRDYWNNNWIWNTVHNHPIIKAEFEQYGSSICLTSAPHVQNTPALIIGSGPSLDKVLSLIHLWGGAIFASPSHSKILDAANKHPDYIVALDTSSRVSEQFGTVEFHKTALVTHPSIDTEVLKAWRWKKYYHRMYEPVNLTLTQMYNALFPYIQAHVVNSGCVVNNAILIAQSLGYNPLFLAGVDFSFPDKVMRFREYEDIGKYVYEPQPLEMADIENDPGLLEAENGYLTTMTNIFYKITLLVNYKLTHPQLIDCSDGIITELPKVSFEDVIKYKANIKEMEKGLSKGKEKKVKIWRSNEKINRVVDAYTIPRGIFGVHHPNKGLGIEIAEGLQEKIKTTEAQLERFKEIMNNWKKEDEVWIRN